MVKKITAAAGGLLAAILLVASISLASGPVLSQARLKPAIIDGFLSGALFRYDRWIECTGLVMQYSRHENFILNALDTRWRSPSHHSCDELLALLQGPPYRIDLAPAVSYVSYPAGSRHLQALLLRVMPLSAIMSLYRILSYVSIVALFFAAWRLSPRLALTIVGPIVATLIFAFGMRRYGGDTMWAPAFFIGFFALSAFLALPRWFDDPARRLGFFCFLGILIAYFEYLHGPLPVILSLTIVLNHYFYAARDQELRWYDAIRHAGTILFCFLFAFVALTVLRLGLLGMVTDQPVWQSFSTGLRSRLSNSAPDVPSVGIADIIGSLWADRREMTGSKTSSAILLGAGLFAWIAGIAVFLYSQVRAGAVPAVGTRNIAIGILVLVISGGGILLWYPLFPNHTVVHSWVMVRMLALPIAYGFVTFILAVGYWHEVRRSQLQTT